ncbi:MAG: hypothetical protein LBT31_00780 [Synergistaceae bacterium]|jgi:hypothetical protein|nr:hypothetical protein [Synergistaceae bacterium]
MALLGMADRDRNVEYDCVDLLPDLEEDVLFVDVLVPGIEEAYTLGIDEWWGEFICEMFL